MNKITVTYIENNGTKHVVEAEQGMTLMEAAVQNSVPGIDADCGGACACGTCHIYVSANLVERDVMEQSMLELATDVRPDSRLACQITIDVAMDGLEVRLPEAQY